MKLRISNFSGGACFCCGSKINELVEALEQNTNKIHEAADVFYHLIIYLEAYNVKIVFFMIRKNISVEYSTCTHKAHDFPPQNSKFVAKKP